MESDALRDLVSRANADAGTLLDARRGQVREQEQKADLTAALRSLITASRSDLVLRPTELSVKSDLAPVWPGLGGVDLTLERAAAPEVLIELKLGKDKLWNCAWDLPKLALSLRKGLGERAFLIGAAPTISWTKELQGPGLFDSNRWATEAFLRQYANCFRLWATAPARLPSELEVEFVSETHFEANDKPYTMRVAEVLDSGSGWVTIDDELRADVVPSGADPERDQMTPEERGSLSSANRLLRLEGGSTYLVGDTGLYINEGAAQSMTDEDLDAVKLLRFDSPADREEDLRQRGWLSIDRFGAPTALAVTIKGMTRATTASFELGGRVALSENGEPERVARPSEDAWRAFAADLDEIDPWSWARWYTPMRMATDGEHWQVLIAQKGKLAFSQGYDAYPPEGDASPAQLERLLSSVRALFD